ncbi:hypothetical protein SARC_02638 [Sphaeroforma arctica JP610]|uniref:Cytochrome c oxidase assembly protein COX15 n=1 Tax=Sphaeroforma arctica JP610 TaxID=667725 RepID=A0A0L0G8H9_9EUKA|nr:hypothetical protein SARC_02638 [Sphaeroforma arctica JP610]KNC85181.1 hypothetical protein SARC_02638 [Sphaeroforma arctica JP610]|eukprot:XP_014159083.1 hypothetical protein SARC_02638 [Sphaeroforma arctica JP610]
MLWCLRGKVPLWGSEQFHRQLSSTLLATSRKAVSYSNRAATYSSLCSCTKLINNNIKLSTLRFVHTSRAQKSSAIPGAVNLSGATTGSQAASVSNAMSKLMTEAQTKRVSVYFMGLAVMTVGAVVLGGITRLTESGLSMTNWHPLFGIRPPMTAAEWEEEFKEYQKYPEYKYTNMHMTVDEFKSIFYMEWFHRIWGRMIGVVYAVPAAYYLTRKWVPSSVKRPIGLVGLLIGCQGLMGWYMVKSGLHEDPDPNAVPRVSQYRLCAHLGLALVIYTVTFWQGLKNMTTPAKITDLRAVSLKYRVHGAAGLIFLTALSGAFVAGLDAGLTYNSFPKMADRWVPTDMWAFSPWYRNILENPTTVQFNHRVLGMTTATTVLWLWAQSRKARLPYRAKVAVNCMAGMVCLQVSLGIATLLYFVPTPLAVTHQSGSVALLTTALWVMNELRFARKAIPRL